MKIGTLPSLHFNCQFGYLKINVCKPLYASTLMTLNSNTKQNTGDLVKKDGLIKLYNINLCNTGINFQWFDTIKFKLFCRYLRLQ